MLPSALLATFLHLSCLGGTHAWGTPKQSFEDWYKETGAELDASCNDSWCTSSDAQGGVDSLPRVPRRQGQAEAAPRVRSQPAQRAQAAAEQGGAHVDLGQRARGGRGGGGAHGAASASGPKLFFTVEWVPEGCTEP